MHLSPFVPPLSVHRYTILHSHQYVTLRINMQALSSSRDHPTATAGVQGSVSERTEPAECAERFNRLREHVPTCCETGMVLTQVLMTLAALLVGVLILAYCVWARRGGSELPRFWMGTELSDRWNRGRMV